MREPNLGIERTVYFYHRGTSGFVPLGNNINGVNATANLLAYHLIDKELGIPAESQFD